MIRSGKIYQLSDEGLVPLIETEYSAEDLLQKLLASYPDLLAGDQMNPADPRRWLLISREAGIPDSEGGGSRWSLDHLFVDQEAVPTLVEVKRSSDSRIRREVVGQMLDYAANVAAYWGPADIRTLYEERCRRDGVDPIEELTSFLELETKTSEIDGTAEHVEAFWQHASDNLAARRLRLLFVADVIPPELERIIEFLNSSMARTEVLGVEVRQFTGSGRQTLVPRVIGRTAAADDVKRSGPRIATDLGERYRRFFGATLARFKALRPDATSTTRVGPDNWLSFTAGRSGFVFSWAFSLHGFRTELYIDSGDKTANKATFDELRRSSDELEHALTMPISWERLDERRASRLAVYYPGTVVGQIDDDPALLDWAVDSMVRMNDVFRLKVKSL